MTSIIRLCSLLVVIVTFTPLNTSAQSPDADSEQKAVLITGASSGIGRKITEVFAENGYFVYAGARKQKDIDALNAIENVQAIELDVTIQAQIDAAVATVNKGGRGLYGLINNAGVYIGGPLIDVDLEEFKWLMDVNVYGVYRMNQAFAPMLIESQGRISTIGSIAGTLAGRYGGQYSMSKHAIEAYTDSLAAEIEPLGVKVSVIEPGNYDSAIGDSAKARTLKKNEDYARKGSPFAKDFEERLNRDWGRSQYKSPDEVAEAALHAMFADEPLRRYMVVPREEEAGWTIGKQIEKLVQLNDWQAYTYSREQLIEKLDAAMASDDVGKLTAMLGESRYRELLEEANEEIPDKETLKQRLLAIRDQAVREIIFGLAMEETMLGPSAKHEQWEMLEWLKAEWKITVEPQNRRPAEGGPKT